MRRRDFLTVLGSAGIALPRAVRAQQPGRMPRIGVLMGFGENDPEGMAQLSGFIHGFQELGWSDGRNVQMDVRWPGGSVDQIRMFAKELVGMQPDVILAQTTPDVAALKRETRTIPIVFVTVADPVGQGFVESLSSPGGNITGFIFTEGSLGGKWLELLTEIAPSVKRAAILFNPDTAPGGGLYFLSSFEAAARSLKVAPITAPVHSDAEIETALTSLGREPGGGLVCIADIFLLVHRAPIILGAARNNLPAVYQVRAFARDGGLLSYGPDAVDLFRRSASYVDLILRGAKPANLPVQLPIKFEMVINLKTAKSLGLTVPPSLLVRANEVIE